MPQPEDVLARLAMAVAHALLHLSADLEPQLLARHVQQLQQLPLRLAALRQLVAQRQLLGARDARGLPRSASRPRRFSAQGSSAGSVRSGALANTSA